MKSGSSDSFLEKVLVYFSFAEESVEHCSTIKLFPFKKKKLTKLISSPDFRATNNLANLIFACLKMTRFFYFSVWNEHVVALNMCEYMYTFILDED